MNLLRKIFFPFVPLYYLIVWIRNWLYDNGLYKSTSYDVPVICVGNLSVGGTGKTPMVEYLIRLLKGSHRLATLSRGYKRKTKGFIIADKNANAESIGDEPFQFYRKFKDITIAVDANRRQGIERLIKSDINAIILDDAFQHRKVKAGLQILLSSYANPFYSDFVLPTGNLREPRSGAKRADIIVITKCPEYLSDLEKENLLKRINPKDKQTVFFSTINYANSIVSAQQSKPIEALNGNNFTLVTGIANPQPLVDYLNKKGLRFEHLKFKDHHDFSSSEINEIKAKELILTTEKDYMRLEDKIDPDRLFFLPIKISIDTSEEFDKKITDFLNRY